MLNKIAKILNKSDVMEKKIIFGIALVVVLGAVFFIGTGFQKRSDVVLRDYTVADDGKKITLHIMVTSSMGYTREFKNDGGGREPHYLTFYNTFGGFNSSFGAIDTVVLEIDLNDTQIFFNRSDERYELVLQKNPDTGEWMKPNRKK